MIEDLIPVAKDIHSIYNFLTNGGLEKVTFYISAKEMDAVRTIIKGISGENFELIRDKEYAEECAKKRDESFISLLPDNGDISLPPSL